MKVRARQVKTSRVLAPRLQSESTTPAVTHCPPGQPRRWPGLGPRATLLLMFDVVMLIIFSIFVILKDRPR